MRTMVVFAAAAAALSMSIVATRADDTGAVGGAVGGAAVGTVVGGPVGTVVGAGVGALIGSSLPSHPSVVYQGPIEVGGTMPDTYTYYDVPQYPAYEYVIVNNQRVVVDRKTRRIVRVIP